MARKHAILSGGSKRRASDYKDNEYELEYKEALMDEGEEFKEGIPWGTKIKGSEEEEECDQDVQYLLPSKTLRHFLGGGVIYTIELYYKDWEDLKFLVFGFSKGKVQKGKKWIGGGQFHFEMLLPRK